MRLVLLLTIVVALMCIAYAYPAEDRVEDHDGAKSGDIAETLTVKLEPQGHENAGPRIARQFGGFGGFGGYGGYGGYRGGYGHYGHGHGGFGHGGFGHGGFGHGGFGGHGHGHYYG